MEKNKRTEKEELLYQQKLACTKCHHKGMVIILKLNNWVAVTCECQKLPEDVVRLSTAYKENDNDLE